MSELCNASGRQSSAQVSTTHAATSSWCDGGTHFGEAALRKFLASTWPNVAQCLRCLARGGNGLCNRTYSRSSVSIPSCCNSSYCHRPRANHGLTRTCSRRHPEDTHHVCSNVCVCHENDCTQACYLEFFLAAATCAARPGPLD